MTSSSSPKPSAPARKEEKFPLARVPGAQTLAEVFAAWDAAGLTPVEVSTEDLQQRIKISHDALTHQVSWTTEKMDGVQAIAIMADALFSMFSEFFKAQPRPAFSSGKARILINLDGNDLSVAMEPMNDPTVLTGVAAATLAEIIYRSRSDDPARAWLDAFGIKIRDENDEK